MRKCNECKEEKSHDDFYISKSGFFSSCCKPCTKYRVRLNRLKNKEYYADYERKRSNEPKRVQARKIYQQGAGKDACNSAKKRYIERNPKKRKVHVITGNAIRYGLIRKRSCIICGDVNSVAHHCDYDKPYDVMWLCQFHHTKWHKENGEGKNG